MRKTRIVKRRRTETDLRVVTYTKLDPADVAELRKRVEKTGASVAAQIRVIVHAALNGRKP